MVYGWIWIAVIVLAVIFEAITDQLVSIWFVPAGIVATVLDFFDVPFVWQLVVFFVIAAAGVIVAKTVLVRFSPKKKTVRTNVDALVGEHCVVTETIDNYAGCGQAKVRGQIWSARGMNENDKFEVGETLTVVAIEGVKLICKK